MESKIEWMLVAIANTTFFLVELILYGRFNPFQLLLPLFAAMICDGIKSRDLCEVMVAGLGIFNGAIEMVARDHHIVIMPGVMIAYVVIKAHEFKG